jgi:hypothetical protein
VRICGKKREEERREKFNFTAVDIMETFFFAVESGVENVVCNVAVL